MNPTVMTVGYVVHNWQILLGQKLRGLGKGLFDGYGGSKETTDKTVDRTMEREFEEETGGMLILGMEKRGVVLITFRDDDMVIELHFYHITKWDGVPRKTDEMIPKWFDLDAIPYDMMWANDQFIVPLHLSGYMYTGQFYFDSPESRILLRREIAVVTELPNHIAQQRL